MKESKLQQYVVNDIESLCLRNKIDRGVNCAPTSDTKSGGFFDQLVYSKYREMEQNVLCALDDELELINIGDGKNRAIGSISMDKNRLMPDILAIGVNSGEYYIFELKTSTQASRQALTELYAYEEELQNHFPTLGRRNIHKIIISTQFNSTLLHAVANAVFKGDSILCLMPVFGGDAVKKYVVHNALEWEPMNSTSLSKELMEGITWCFYQASDYKDVISEREVVQDMKFAVDYLKDVEGEHSGSGFCFVWKRKRTGNKLFPTSTDYGVTLFDVNPYRTSVRHLARQKDSLSKYTMKNFGKHAYYEYSGLVLKKYTDKIRDLFF